MYSSLSPPYPNDMDNYIFDSAEATKQLENQSNQGHTAEVMQCCDK
jgi:hypothetical protein